MPIPYVNVGSDILKSYIAGRQMMMAQQQMAMEQQRIGIERQRVAQENTHRIAEQAHATAALAQLTKYQQAEVKREQEKADFEWEHGKKQDIQAGLEGLTPGQSQVVQTGAPRVSNEQAAQDLLRPDALPSPQDQTQSIVDQAPTSDEAIAGAPTSPELQFQQPIGPKPLVAGPQNVIPTQSFEAPDMVSPSGRVRISAAQQAAIPVKPPLSEEERLRITHENAMQLEAKRQEQEQRRLEEEGKHWTAQIAVQNRAADLALANLKETMSLRRDVFGVKIADDAGKIAEKVIAGPVFQKQLNNYGPLMDYMKDLTAKDANGRAGNTSGIADAEAMNRLNVMIAGTPLASMARVKDFADSLKTTPENLGNKIRQLTSKNNVLLSPDQKKQLGLAIHQALINVHSDYVMRFNAGAQQMKEIHFEKDPATITKYSGILGDFKDEK